ncbi:hypothetical protein J6590_061435 [Homalodisca vitripennis]|nr:hypothetical protein J6590_061435 [Homalodisca vitripennis]
MEGPHNGTMVVSHGGGERAVLHNGSDKFMAFVENPTQLTLVEVNPTSNGAAAETRLTPHRQEPVDMQNLFLELTESSLSPGLSADRTSRSSCVNIPESSSVEWWSVRSPPQPPPSILCTHSCLEILLLPHFSYV